MNKQQFLAMSLPFNTIVCVKYTHKPDISEYEDLIGLLDGRVITGETEEDDPLLPISDYRVILHPLSDLTKEIEHKGEKFVPLEILCDIYGAKFDRPYINERSAGFVYGFSAKDVLNVKNMIENKFWQIHKLIEWHFDLFGGINSGDAIDVNSLSENPYK